MRHARTAEAITANRVGLTPIGRYPLRALSRYHAAETRPGTVDSLLRRGPVAKRGAGLTEYGSACPMDEQPGTLMSPGSEADGGEMKGVLGA